MFEFKKKSTPPPYLLLHVNKNVNNIDVDRNASKMSIENRNASENVKRNVSREASFRYATILQEKLKGNDIT